MAETNNAGGTLRITHLNIRQSIFFLVLKIILLDIFGALASVLYFSSVSGEFLPQIFDNFLLSYNLFFFSILVILKIVLTTFVILQWINEYYEIWPNAIIYKTGFINTKEEKHPTEHIRAIKMEQGFFGKIFGFGTISLYDWFTQKHFLLYLIHNPNKYFSVVEGLIPKAEEEKETFREHRSP